MRLSVLTAASRARQHANTNTSQQKIIHGPETLSADEKLSTSSSLPAAMMADIEDGCDTCRMTAALVDNDAHEVASLVTTQQPIRSQSNESDHADEISLAETPSSECVDDSVQIVQCAQTDNAVTHSTA